MKDTHKDAVWHKLEWSDYASAFLITSKESYFPGDNYYWCCELRFHYLALL